MRFIGLKEFFKQFPLIFTLACIDQFTKSFMITFLKTQTGMIYKLTSFLSFVFAWNHGISFGFLGQYYQYSNYIFLVVNCMIVGYLIAILKDMHKGIQVTGVAIIIGGACGNIIDRILRGAVFDFIYFHYDNYGFPAFNLADAFINFGVFLVIISLFRSSK